MDSRLAEEGGAIRRRRECLGCGRRFTTFERVEEVPLWVVKRTGQREPFDRAKVVAGVRAACKNRPVTDASSRSWPRGGGGPAGRDERADQPAGGRGGARAAAGLDDVAYLRFASVYKGFEDVGDFQREVGLLTKTTEPKRK